MIKVLTEKKDIDKAIELYAKSFNDSDLFVELFFTQYKKEYIIYGEYIGDDLAFICFMVKKRIHVNGNKEIAKLIVGVAVDDKYKNNGIMKKNLNEVIKLNSTYKIFIQAYNWNIYKSFEFYPCTIKKAYRLRNDQILHKKKDDIIEMIDFNLINRIRNDFIKINKIENFSYRTEKENKKILKMHIAGGDIILQSKRAYAIISNDCVIECCYYELLDLIKLLSNLEQQPKVYSFLDLDKRFFNFLEEEKIETKIFKENIKLFFSEYF